MSSLPRSDACIVELERVDLEIAGSRVLSGIDLQLERDRHCGIVGPNGSGKSSLLGLIAGSLWPAPGRGARRYTFDGTRHADAVEARRRIAVVGPELQDLYTRWGWNFSALDVVLSGLFRTDVPRRAAAEGERARAQARLAELELGALAARPFLRLSRGEQRRVLIARAMAFEPEVLLLDEPAAGLDAEARRRLDASIAEVARTATVVATAHAVEQLPSVCGDVLRIEAGRIVGREAFDAGRLASSGTLAPPALSRSAPKPAGRRASPSPPPLVEIEHADVWRNGRRVLKDVCWRLEPDRHWLISGANGAGKSSLLKLVHGQLRPARGGTIAWPGLGNPRNVWALRRRVAYVSPELQAEYLYPTTVHDCIASGIESSIGLTRPLTPAEKDRVAELIERFSLTALADRRLASLSYGQRRRALIARTLVNAPRVLLLDEPTEGLDPSTAREVLAEIGESIAAGTSLVCASHLADVGSVFDCRMRLDAGAIVETSGSGLRDADDDGAPRGSSASAPSRASRCRPR